MKLEKQVEIGLDSEYGRILQMIEISEEDSKILKRNKILVTELNVREGNTDNWRKMFLIENDPELLNRLNNLQDKE
jgi:hypothetical protein